MICDKIHSLVLPYQLQQFIPGEKYYLPEFGLIKGKQINRITFFWYDIFDSAFTNMILTLVDDNDKKILVDIPLKQLEFRTSSAPSLKLHRRYIQYYYNINLAKSYIRLFTPSPVTASSNLFFSFYYRD